MRSIPGQGTKTLHAARLGQNKKTNKKTENKQTKNTGEEQNKPKAKKINILGREYSKVT